MHRLIVSALMLAASMVSWAQPVDTRVVAYTHIARNVSNLVLANQDGSQAVTVYSTRSSLSGLDFAPGGGKVAFSEQGTLKVLAYSPLGSVTGITTLAAGDLGSDPDFSPDGSRIIYVGNQAEHPRVREVAADGSSAPVDLTADMSGLMEVAWFGSINAFVYLRQYEADQRYEVRLVTLDPGTREVMSDSLVLTTDGSAFRAISNLDVARTKNSILVTLHYPTAMRVTEYNLDSPPGFTDHASGMRAHFSANDSKIVYVTTDRSYVNSLVVDSGAITRLTKRGSFGWTDARP